MADLGRPADMTGIVTVMQNGVQAINLLSQVMSSAFSRFVTVPSSASSSGTFGQMAVDSTALYVCYATDSWLKCNGTTSF